MAATCAERERGAVGCQSQAIPAAPEIHQATAGRVGGTACTRHCWEQTPRGVGRRISHTATSKCTQRHHAIAGQAHIAGRTAPAIGPPFEPVRAVRARPGARCHQLAPIRGPGQRAQAALALCIHHWREGKFQVVCLHHGNGGLVCETDCQPATIGRERHRKRLIRPARAVAWPLGVKQFQAFFRHVVKTNISIHTGAGQALAVWRKLGSVNLAVIVGVARKLLACAPSCGAAKQAQTVFTPQPDSQHLTVRRKAQVGDGVGQAGNALHHGTRGAVEQIDIVIGRPATHSDRFTIGCDGCSKQPPIVARTNRRPQSLQKLSV